MADAFAFSKSLPASPPPLDEFKQLVDSTIGRGIPASEWSLLQSCLEIAHPALDAARQDRLADAAFQYEQVGELIRQSPQLSVAGQLVTEVFLKPGWAYLRYKQHEYDKAREILLRASHIDQRLIDEFGFAVLSGHRLQLAQNILRLEARRGNCDQAMRLGSSLLDYIELRIEPASANWVSARATLDCVPKATMEHYFNKICGELAMVLAGRNDGDAEVLFRPLRSHAQEQACQDSSFGSHAHQWMAMKRWALKGELGEFFESAIRMLRLGRMAEPSLWHATIVEVAAICRSLDAEASALARRLVAEASSLSDAPSEVRQAAQIDSTRPAGVRQHPRIRGHAFNAGS